VREEAFVLNSGRLKTFNSSAGVSWSFCENCGTSIKYANDRHLPHIDFHLATLRPGIFINPKFHVQVKEKLPWVTISDNLPQFQRWRRD
jgi:hypothetical protein